MPQSNQPTPTGRFKYKCRNCGKEYLHAAVTSYDMANMFFIGIVSELQVPKPIIGQVPRMVEIHHCTNYEHGVADLIALVKD